MASCVASGPGSRWQKLSARTNSSSLIHFRRSTTSRCIRPIWPMGPPNASHPSLRKYQKISDIETFSTSLDVTAPVLCAALSSRIPCRLPRLLCFCSGGGGGLDEPPCDLLPIDVLHEGVDVASRRRPVVEVVRVLVHIEDEERLTASRERGVIPRPVVVQVALGAAREDDPARSAGERVRGAPELALPSRVRAE